jgi:hypothetical protein
LKEVPLKTVREKMWNKNVWRRLVGRSVRKKCRGEMSEEEGGRKL